MEMARVPKLLDVELSLCGGHGFWSEPGKIDTEASPSEATMEGRMADSLAIVPYIVPGSRKRGRMDATSYSMGSDGDGFIPHAPLPLVIEPLHALPPDIEPRIDAPGTTEPAWIRDWLFPHLGLPVDLELHFITKKSLQSSDIDPKQNRFLLPRDAISCLVPLLAGTEMKAASLSRKESGELPQQPESLQHGKRRKVRGRQHGGQPVRIAERCGEISELMLTRWDGSGGTVLKGKSYLSILARAGLQKGDTVELWAFRTSKMVPLFGTWCALANSLHLVMASKADEEQQLPPPPVLDAMA